MGLNSSSFHCQFIFGFWIFVPTCATSTVGKMTHFQNQPGFLEFVCKCSCSDPKCVLAVIWKLHVFYDLNFLKNSAWICVSLELCKYNFMFRQKGPCDMKSWKRINIERKKDNRIIFPETDSAKVWQTLSVTVQQTENLIFSPLCALKEGETHWH